MPSIRAFEDGDIAGWHAVCEAARRVDDPEHPPVAQAGTRALLRAIPHEGRLMRWVSMGAAGDVAGVAHVFFADSANRGWGFVNVVVHPEHRHCGHGRALLGAAAAATAAEGRTTVVMTTHPHDGSSAWAESVGATKAQFLLESTLDMADAVDEPANAAKPGYRIERWIGACPDERLASFIHAKDAMFDAPDSGLGYEPTATTVERQRIAERSRDEREADLWVVVAVHEASGEVAGLTELEIDRNCPELAHQEDTAVVPSHRGHGLGLWIKADMLRWLRAEASPVRHIRTSTDDSNAYMLAINERLGFRRTGICEQWKLAVSTPTSTVEPQPGE
jgi:GNAT superfamily N-acetyltransferase